MNHIKRQPVWSLEQKKKQTHTLAATTYERIHSIKRMMYVAAPEAVVGGGKHTHTYTHTTTHTRIQYIKRP